MRLAQAHGIKVDTLDPFNEPNTGYWGTRLGADPGAATRILYVVRSREASSLRDLAIWARPEATGRP